MRAHLAVGIGSILLLLVVVLSSFPGLAQGPLVPAVRPGDSTGAPLSGPTPVSNPPAAPASVPIQSGAASGSSHPAAPHPADTCSGTPNWVSGSTNFFTDVNVCFSILGQRGYVNFPTVPLQGNISQYALGFYVNISSNVRIFAANLCLWATQWPAPGVGAQPVPGYDPAQWNAEDCRPMVTGTQLGLNPDTAYYFVNCYKYFWPGTNLSFMIEVTSGVGVVRSYQTLNETESYPSGYTTYPTWTVYVQSPFASSNFTNDFRVATIPSTLTLPSFSPNPTQNVQIVLSSFNQSGGPPPPIPAATATYSIITPGKSGTSTAYGVNFGPANSTVMTLDHPIIAEPAGTKVSFNITAFRYWDGPSHIDSVVSTPFNFTFAAGGGWPLDNAPLEQNAQLNSSPDVLLPGVTSLPTDTPVNVSVREPIENVTFTASEVDYTFTDHGATRLGSIPMIATSANSSYAILPGLPNGTSMRFSLVVKDVFGDADSSGFYTYTESGPPIPGPPAGQGYVFVEVYDVATDHLIAGSNFTIANLSWFQNSQTNPFGFGALVAGGPTQAVYLYDGTYYLTVHAFGSTVERPITIAAGKAVQTITFYVSSSPVFVQTSSPAPPLYTFGAVAGILAAAVTILPIRNWFAERRAKAEAEQRRVTL